MYQYWAYAVNKEDSNLLYLPKVRHGAIHSQSQRFYPPVRTTVIFKEAPSAS